MNKAFVREPEPDGRAYCPRCGSLGSLVQQTVLDHHVRPAARSRLGDSAWFCEFARCEVAYFDLFERVATIGELQTVVYPKDVNAPVCACFGFTTADIDADLEQGVPTRIRALLEKSKSPAAKCHTLAADGHCCMREVQRLYMKGLANQRG